MKKPFILLPALLIVIFVIFSVIDHNDYVVEKKMWKIQQQFTLQVKYGIPSKEESESLAAMYQGLIRQYPKSSLIPRIYMQIGQVYAVQKNFEKARDNYSEVLKRVPQQKVLCSEALLGIGLSYENEKNDAQALKTYQQIVKNYPLTDIGFNMPFYIAGYYHRLNKDAEMENVFQESEGFYLKVAQENPDSSKGFNALRLLAATYLIEEKWNIAVKIYEKVLLDYSRTPYLDWKTAGSIVYSINDISIKKLIDTDQAISFYQMFIEDHPGYPLDKFLRQVIASLQDVKSGKKDFAIHKI